MLRQRKSSNGGKTPLNKCSEASSQVAAGTQSHVREARLQRGEQAYSSKPGLLNLCSSQCLCTRALALCRIDMFEAGIRATLFAWFSCRNTLLLRFVHEHLMSILKPFAEHVKDLEKQAPSRTGHSILLNQTWVAISPICLHPFLAALGTSVVKP